MPEFNLQDLITSRNNSIQEVQDRFLSAVRKMLIGRTVHVRWVDDKNPQDGKPTIDDEIKVAIVKNGFPKRSGREEKVEFIVEDQNGTGLYVWSSAQVTVLD